MRQIKTSGGIVLGPEDSPWIDIVPLPPGRRVNLDEAESAAVDPQTQWSRIDKYRTPHGTTVGVLGVNQRLGLSIRFLRPARQRSNVNALRRIAAVDQIPPAVAGAVLAACVGLRNRDSITGIAPAIVAHACSLQPIGPKTKYNNSDIANMAHRAASHMMAAMTEKEEIDASIPTGTVDRSRFWLAVSRRLWRPDMLQRIGQQGEIPDFEFGYMMSQVAAIEPLLLPRDASVSITARLDVKFPDDEIVRGAAWPQALELAAGDISPEALSWLSGGSLPTGEMTIDAVYETDQEAPPTPDSVTALALARQFVREAERDGFYAPAGAFIVDIPNDLHLFAWGVRQLKVWCEPREPYCLWCGVINKDDKLSCIFQWSPDSELRSWILHELIKPALQATLAALWRDLRVAGEQVFPARNSAASRSSKRSRQSTAGRSHTGRALPGKRYVLNGRRTWGSKEERDVIRRRAHGVRGHLRNLPDGWQRSEEAVELAREHGISLPDGFTFVQPHVRGENRDEADAPEVTVVQAQGLSSLVTLLDL